MNHLRSKIKDYISLQLDKKINIIDEIIPEKTENFTFIDNVYFVQNFDKKNLMNTLFCILLKNYILEKVTKRIIEIKKKI